MHSSRRSFLKTALCSLAALPFLGQFPAFAADADLPMAKETEDPAKALKYTANADQAPKGSPRKNKDKAKQYCYNCQLFTRLDGTGKTGKGKCMIMPKNRVNANAWCMSWVQNPAIKE